MCNSLRVSYVHARMHGHMNAYVSIYTTCCII